MTKMTKEDVRMLTKLANRMLVVADEGDWSALEGVMPSVEELAYLTKLSTLLGNGGVGGFEIIKDECNLELGEVHLIVKNEYTTQEVKSHTWENNDSIYSSLDAKVTPNNKL